MSRVEFQSSLSRVFDCPLNWVFNSAQPHIPAADTRCTRSLSLLQRVQSGGSRATETAPTDCHRALIRRRHGCSLNCAALAPMAGSNQSCTVGCARCQEISVPLPLGFLHATSERWARHKGAINAHPVASSCMLMLTRCRMRDGPRTGSFAFGITKTELEGSDELCRRALTNWTIARR